LLSELPNILDAETPDGRDEADNAELKRFGHIRNFAFSPKQHFEIGEALGLMDFANAAKIAGSRFTVLKGALARLERALGQFMLDLHTTEHGY
jgi:seryl-tRNA synthetase